MSEQAIIGPAGAFLLLVSVLSLVFAVVTGLVARSRRRGFWPWFLLGGFFSVFALVAVALMGKSGNPCTDCREKIDPLARVCPHCGAQQTAIV